MTAQKINDELADKDFSPQYKHYKRKLLKGECGYGGCKNKGLELPNGDRRFFCQAHLDYYNERAKRYYQEHKVLKGGANEQHA